MKRAIVYTVLSAHLFFLFYIHLSFNPENKKSHKPLIVKTITPSAQPKEKSASPTRAVSQTKPKQSAPPASKPASTPKPAKPPAKKAPPIADKKLVQAKKKAPVKPVQDEKREKMSQKLLQELEDNLSKLEPTPDKKRAASKKFDAPSPVAPIGPLSIDASSRDASIDESYEASLIGYLKETLNLPEYGEVKIQLTLKQDGSVVNLVVLKTESEKNRKYLEASLPRLRFPQLEGSRKQETFVFTFCNEL
ncbi:MAG: flagellar hook-length control protein FliK [Chlamydiales bacterium]|nr:flagellar hook-length control protein FliK [Chlamydiales bacterium]